MFEVKSGRRPGSRNQQKHVPPTTRDNAMYLVVRERKNYMKFKPCFRSKLLQDSDVPFQAPFAHGFAIFAQTTPSMSRRLTKCYASWELPDERS